MSHVTCKDPDSEFQIRSLPALLKACERLGLELVKQKTFRTWKTDHGSLVGDYPVPEGYSEDEIGENAEYVTRVAGLTDEERTRSSAPYEIGWVPSRKHPGSYAYMYDFYNGGYGLEEKCGKGAESLLMHYRMECDKLTAEENGDEITFTEQKDGSWVAVVEVDDDRLMEVD